MSLNSGSNPKLKHTELDAILFPEFDYPSQVAVATREDSIFFKQFSWDSADFIAQETSGAGLWQESSDEEEYPDEASPRAANKKTHSIKLWQRNLFIPKNFFDDAKHNYVEEQVKSMGRKGKIALDKHAMDAGYVGGFSTHTTPDGAYVWSDSHININGDTVDNLETGEMSATNFEVLVRSLVEQKDQDGDLGGHDPAGLFVPPALMKSAIEVTQSELLPGGMDNDVNWLSKLYPGLVVKMNQLLGGTYHTETNANTAYYLVSKNHHIKRAIRESLNTTFVDWKTDPKNRYCYKGRVRELVFAATWEGAVASNGSA